MEALPSIPLSIARAEQQTIKIVVFILKQPPDFVRYVLKKDMCHCGRKSSVKIVTIIVGIAA